MGQSEEMFTDKIECGKSYYCQSPYMQCMVFVCSSVLYCFHMLIMVQCSLVVLQCTLTGPFLFVLLTRGCVHVHAGCDKQACATYSRIKFEKQGHFLLVQ